MTGCAKIACAVPTPYAITARCLGCRDQLTQAVCEEHCDELCTGMLMGLLRSKCCNKPCTLVRIEAA